MGVNFHIQTLTNEKTGEPKTAISCDIAEETTEREMNQFYINLKKYVRHIEEILDEEEKENG